MEADDWYVPRRLNHEGAREHHLRNLQQLFAYHGATLHGIWLDFIRYSVRRAAL